MVRLGPFERQPAVAVALSGGRDSTLLCHFARRWIDQRRGRLVALIVDHGLRPESAEEASRVAQQCERSGIDARILRWRGDKPTTAIQERAREARYRLLERACRDHGILHLLLGHQATDQAETIAMRTQRRSGVIGRAGMAPIVERADVRLLRPLLRFSRTTIDATVRSLALTFVDDPSNDDVRFWRSRWRRSDPVVVDPMDNAAARDAVLDRLYHWAGLHVQWHPLGPALIDRAALQDLSAGDRAALLGRLIRTVGGASHAPTGDRLARLASALLSGGTHTVGGTVVVTGRGRIMITREPASIDDIVRIEPGQSGVWDRRFRIVNRRTSTITAKPSVRWPEGPFRPRLALPRPALVLAGLPALLAGDDILTVGPFDASERHSDTSVHACATAPFGEAPFVV